MELPLLDDLDCVSAVKEAMELQVEACMKEGDEVTAANPCNTNVEENPMTALVPPHGIFSQN